MSDDEDYDPEEEAEHLNEVRERLRASRVELARTVHALQRKRRTPEQVRAVIDRAKRIVYKSILLRSKHLQQRQIQ